MRSLTFGWAFNQPIKDVEWPPNLQSLTFGNNFNQPIKDVKWPLLAEVKQIDIRFRPHIIYSGHRFRKAIEALKNRKKTKKLTLPKPDQWTQWQQLCYKSAQEFTQQDHQVLQTYAQAVNIPNPQKLSAKQLCVELARNLEQYLNTVKTQPTLNCHNDSTLEGDEFSEISNEFIIQDDMGYCFTKAEILKLKKHPYINLAWDQVKVKGRPIKESPAFSNMKTNNIHEMLSSRENH